MAVDYLPPIAGTYRAYQGALIRQNGEVSPVQEGNSSLRQFSFDGRYEVQPSTAALVLDSLGTNSTPSFGGLSFGVTALMACRLTTEKLLPAIGFSEYLDGSGVATCVVSGDLPCIVEKQGEQTNVNPTNPG